MDDSRALRAENVLLRSECARLRTENEALKGENARLVEENKDLKKQLRSYHAKKGLGPKTKLRADPFGKNPNPPFNMMGSNTAGGFA